MSIPSCDSLACEKQASKSVTSCSAHQGESRGSSIRAEGYLSPPAFRRARSAGDAALDRGG